MLIHLGGDVAIPGKCIIMILNSNVEKSSIVKDYLAVVKEENFVHDLADEGSGRAFIITDRGVFISPVSSATLKKRSDSILESVFPKKQ
ncbi:MAG TPA: DUF370 domain-containing protein [Desulfotomaculum sp.]|nr:MAG: hypothetical protein XD78_0970 [Desulfotomaculum sp. 46_296]HAG10069.1 DUF370 domain-containing protein [Desulfotomaculum sp.]HBY04483.1 DUF370 domain-containing protein [Desulfotomaculum sp.]